MPSVQDPHYCLRKQKEIEKEKVKNRERKQGVVLKSEEVYFFLCLAFFRQVAVDGDYNQHNKRLADKRCPNHLQ